MHSTGIEGTDGVVRSLESVARFVADDVEATLQDWGNETVNDARKHHKFGNPYSKGYKARTGNADKSMQADAKGATVRIWINPDQVKTKKGYVYPALLHDGTKHIEADPFLTNAVNRKIKILPEMIRKGIHKILKQTGV